MQLQEAYNLKADVQERRKLIQHILKENSQLQQRIKEDKGDTGPPKFVPFSVSAKVLHVDPVPPAPMKESQQQKVERSRENRKRETESPAQLSDSRSAEPAPRSVVVESTSVDLKHDRLKQLEKVSLNLVGADKRGHGNKSERVGRVRRGRRERDEDVAEYIKPSGRPVAYSLFDLIKADAENTNSAAATALLCASEPYMYENAIPSEAQPDPSFPSAPRGVTSEPFCGSQSASRPNRTRPRPESSRGRVHRGHGRDRGRGRGRAHT